MPYLSRADAEALGVGAPTTARCGFEACAAFRVKDYCRSCDVFFERCPLHPHTYGEHATHRTGPSPTLDELARGRT